jgi:UDP-glucuronate 4-epimerase
MISEPLTILVTGSSGFIGTHVVRHLTDAGHKVIGYDLIQPEDRFPDGSIYLCGDIRTARLPHEGIDAVVHLAALAGVRPSMDRPFDYLSTNVTGTMRLLDHCRIHGIPRFVFASSSSVYGPESPLPFAENGLTDPCSPYALTKLHAEHWCRLYARQHGIQVCALRFFSVWGPGQRPDLALESFQRAIEQDRPVTVLGDGSHRRDLTHVSDVVRAIELAIGFQGGGFETFNVGTGQNHSVMDMVAHAAAKAGKEPTIVHHPAHPADVQQTLADPRKSQNLLGFTPLHPFTGG